LNLLLSRIADIIKADLPQWIDDISIHNVAIDSRQEAIPFRTLFFALIDKRDGHHYIHEMYDKGIMAFVISHDIQYDAFPNASFLKVKNTLTALQSLASMYRSKFKLPVIGITGSNGKTIVKEWLYQMLHTHYKICRSPKSFNSQIGVPLSVLQLNERHTLAMFEAGISTKDEMSRLQKIIKPNIGILTNIGDAHDSGFENKQQKLNEKLKLFTACQKIITRDIYIMSLSDTSRFVQWSYNNAESCAAYKFQRTKDNNLRYCTLYFQNEQQEFILPFQDKASVENFLHCYVLMHQLEFSHDEIMEAAMHISALPMRMAMQEGNNNCTIIDDAYSNDIASLKIALDFHKHQAIHQAHILILSEVDTKEYELDQYIKHLISLLPLYPLQEIYFIGTSFERYADDFKNIDASLYYIPDIVQLRYRLLQQAFSDTCILIKGARVFQLETIVDMLIKKTHQTHLEINLNALTHNLNIYRSKLRPTTRMMVMVKALSYGSGGYEIASLLQNQQVDYLAVAYADEGIELRQQGIQLPIMVMNVDEESMAQVIAYNLEPEIYSFTQLQLFGEYVSQRNELAYPIHIKLDTGMHRLGFIQEELIQLCIYLQSYPYVKIASVFSHLAASDEANHDDFTHLQIKKFIQLSQYISQNISYQFIRHILNSAGITRHNDAQYEMVRLGIGLYGVDPSPAMQSSLEVVSQLKTYILQTKEVAQGHTIGYSRKGVVTTSMRIAIVAIGYADGLPRVLSNGKGQMLIHGQLAPIVGNICMDMTMLDITAIPEAKAGDEVLVFGHLPTVSQVAIQANTIAYEILTGISSRVKRVYIS